MADMAAVRQWAREQGFAVGDRGRLSPDLVRSYEAAHGGTAPAPSKAPAPRRPAALAAARPAGRSPASRIQETAARASSSRGTAGGGRTVHARTPWDWPRRTG